MSSAKVNWGKSEALLMGDWNRGPPSLPGGLMWKKGGFKYLGIFLGNGDFVTKNWDCMLEKIKGRLQRWKWLLPKTVLSRSYAHNQQSGGILVMA